MIDVSNNNGHVNWKEVHKAGHRIAAIKASESSANFHGSYFDDAFFRYNMIGANANGIVACPYFFAHPTWDAKAQARHFLSLAGRFSHEKNNGKLILDIEQTNNVADIKLREWVAEFLHVLQSVVRYRPIIYTYSAFAPKFGREFVAHPLWIANYDNRAGLPPNSRGEWNKQNVWAHQFTDMGTVKGISGHVDLSHRFAALRHFKTRRVF